MTHSLANRTETKNAPDGRIACISLRSQSTNCGFRQDPGTKTFVVATERTAPNTPLTINLYLLERSEKAVFMLIQGGDGREIPIQKDNDRFAA